MDYLDNSEVEYVFKELSDQIILPNSKLIDQHLADTLSIVGQVYLDMGFERGKIVIELSNRISNILNQLEEVLN